MYDEMSAVNKVWLSDKTEVTVVDYGSCEQAEEAHHSDRRQEGGCA